MSYKFLVFEKYKVQNTLGGEIFRLTLYSHSHHSRWPDDIIAPDNISLQAALVLVWHCT